MQKMAFPHLDLTLEKDTGGVRVTQNGKSYLARRWQLTDEVKGVIRKTTHHGFDKLWVDGHPKNGNK